MRLSSLVAWLHRGGQWAYWWTMPDRKSVWFPAGQPAPVPQGERNVYMGVHPVTEIPTLNAKGKPVLPEHARSQIASIAAINCLFAEFDLKDFDGDRGRLRDHLATIAPRANIVVDSGGGYHLYWLLDQPFMLNSDAARERAIRLQADWVTRVGGDPASKDLARVLRVPGTLNYKYDPAPLVTIKRGRYGHR
jgi:hypothetical protein